MRLAPWYHSAESGASAGIVVGIEEETLHLARTGCRSNEVDRLQPCPERRQFASPVARHAGCRSPGRHGWRAVLPLAFHLGGWTVPMGLPAGLLRRSPGRRVAETGSYHRRTRDHSCIETQASEIVGLRRVEPVSTAGRSGGHAGTRGRRAIQVDHSTSVSVTRLMVQASG